MRILSGAVLAATLFSFAAQAAPGDPRINIDGASCNDVRRIVDRNGAAILRYASSQSDRVLFDRFVVHSGFCMAGEAALPKTIFRREGPCRLLTCQMPDYEDRVFPNRP